MSVAAPAVSATNANLANNTTNSTAGELTENIQYMKLLHELKAQFPAVPDEFVQGCIAQVRHHK